MCIEPSQGDTWPKDPVFAACSQVDYSTQTIWILFAPSRTAGWCGGLPTLSAGAAIQKLDAGGYLGLSASSSEGLETRILMTTNILFHNAYPSVNNGSSPEYVQLDRTGVTTGTTGARLPLRWTIRPLDGTDYTATTGTVYFCGQRYFRKYSGNGFGFVWARRQRLFPYLTNPVNVDSYSEWPLWCDHYYAAYHNVPKQHPRC